jgi:hypothetical protein
VEAELVREVFELWGKAEETVAVTSSEAPEEVVTTGVTRGGTRF